MTSIIYPLILFALGIVAIYFERDPSVWFAASMVVIAL